MLRWAEEQRVSREKRSIIQDLSVLTIYGITRFALPATRTRQAGFVDKIKPAYSNDSSLFELGCYVYFRIDLWHVQNKCDKFRKDALDFCLDEFVSVFEDALGFDYANEIIQNRLDLYGQLIREGDSDRINFYLLQLLIRTKNNTLPELHDFDNYTIVISDFFEKMGLEITVKAFESAMLPEIFNNFKYIYQRLENGQH